MTSSKVYRQLIMPTIVPIGVMIVTGALILLIGELLLHLKQETVKHQIERVELWAAVAIAIAILAGCAYIATRPQGTLGKLDEPLALGKRPLLADPLPPVDVMARTGSLGTVKDIVPGFTLYARNGALATVREVLPSARESYGHLRKGLIYSQGLQGANDEMWIPGEAVSAVYPETQSAFLAIAGDEIEYLGWHKPPEGFRRTPLKEEAKLY